MHQPERPTTSPTDQFVEAIAQRVAAILAPKIETANALRPRLLTVDQAAVYLGRTDSAIRGMLKRGVVPRMRIDGRVMFDVQDLNALIEQNKVEEHDH